jgi:hypothetical protein
MVEPIMKAAPTVAAAAVDANNEPICVADFPDWDTMDAATPVDACTTFPTILPAIIRAPTAASVPTMLTVLEATAVAVFPDIFESVYTTAPVASEAAVAAECIRIQCWGTGGSRISCGSDDCCGTTTFIFKAR